MRISTMIAVYTLLFSMTVGLSSFAADIRNRSDADLALLRLEIEKSGDTTYKLRKEGSVDAELNGFDELKGRARSSLGKMSTAKKNFLKMLSQAAPFAQQLAQLERQAKNNQQAKQALASAKKQMSAGKAALKKAYSDVKNYELAYNSAAMSYLDKIGNTKKTVAALNKQYADMRKNPEVKAALALISKEDKKKYTLTPSEAVQGALDKVKKYEENILRFEIPLLSNNPKKLAIKANLNGTAKTVVLKAGTKISMISEADAKAMGMVWGSYSPTENVTVGGERQARPVSVVSKIVIGKITVTDINFVVVPSLAEPVFANNALRGMKVTPNVKNKVVVVSKLK
jgi:hypothetical protein